MVLDTDAYNEIDDQYAIAYLLLHQEKLHTQALYAAPFSNARADSPAEGMQKSHEEILHILALMHMPALKTKFFRELKRICRMSLRRCTLPLLRT